MRRERIKSISLKNISYKFEDGFEILKDLNFDILPGKSVALYGGPGSGKSLLLKIIAGILTPTMGSVLYNEKNIADLTFEEFVPLRLSTSICFENGGLLMNKSIADNLKLSLIYHKQWRSERSRNLYENLCHDFKLQKALNLRPAQVSDSVKKLAGIAKSFLTNPQIIFLDEPSLGIGDEATETLKKWVKKHREDFVDAVVVVASHDKRFIESLKLSGEFEQISLDQHLTKVA